MKKVISLLLSMAIMLPCSALFVHAQAVDTPVGVLVEVVDESVYLETCVIEGNQASVVTQSGYVVSVVIAGEQLSATLLKVFDISDGNLTEWFASLFNETDLNICVFDIFFTDYNGDYIAVNAVFQVSIAIGDQFKDPVVYYVAENGEMQRLDSSFENGMITFSTNHNSYYMVAESTYTLAGLEDETAPELEGETTPETADDEESAGDDVVGIELAEQYSPNTGEQVSVCLMLLLLLSGLSVALVSFKKHRNF